MPMKRMKEKLYQLFSRVFRREIIRDGFRGILGRDPEEEALRAYEGSLPALGMEGFVKDLTTSKEAWERQKLVHAEELIRAAYQGVLRRDVDRVGLNSYLSSMPVLGLKGVIKDLTNSKESWEKQLELRKEQIIVEIFNAIHGRKADNKSIESIKGIVSIIGLSGIVKAVCAKPNTTNQLVVIQSCDKDVYAPLMEASAVSNKLYCNKYGLTYNSYVGIKRGFFPWHACFNRIIMLKEYLNQ